VSHDLQQQKIEDEIKKLEEMGGKFSHHLIDARDSTFSRFPIIFVLLSTFGLVATFYGFEKIIDEIDFFAKHPYMVLVTGMVILVMTGALYKKLD
jgi:hypothetical protein